MELTILQTSDAFKYSRMLRATSQTAIEYARRHGFSYESFIGVKRGFHNAQAAFNRIFMLDELIERGWRGWALHMDADAYVYDLDFELRGYLANKADQSAIMATIPDQPVPWSINSGVLFFNLGHPQGVALVKEWKRRFMAVPDETLRDLTSVWDDINDQIMLYSSLHENEALRTSVYFEDAKLFNHVQGRFIRQFLNSLDNNIETRTEKIEIAVRDVLRKALATEAIGIEEKLVAEFYRIILDRDPDPGAQGYVDLLANRGLAQATPALISSLLNSEEYRRRIGAI